MHLIQWWHYLIYVHGMNISGSFCSSIMEGSDIISEKHMLDIIPSIEVEFLIDTLHLFSYHPFYFWIFVGTI